MVKRKSAEQASTEERQGGIAVLDELAKSFAARVNRTKCILEDGANLKWSLRARYREHQIELISNQEQMLIDVEATYGQFTLLEIKLVRRPGTRSADSILDISDHAYAISPVAVPTLSRAQSNLIASGAIESILKSVSPRHGEHISVSEKLVRIIMRNPTRERVRAFIDAVVDFMPHDLGRNQQVSEVLPDSLLPLMPLLAKWAISDDEERSRKLKRCTQTTRRRLVDKVVPLLPDINRYLDTFGRNPTEQACAVGDLAQAAVEAQALIGADAKIGVKKIGVKDPRIPISKRVGRKL